MNVQDALEVLSRFEDRVADFYNWLAVQLHEHEEAAKLFIRLGREEQGHAGRLRYQQQQFEKELRGLPVEGVEGVVQVSIALIDDFMREHPSPTVHEALWFARGLESAGGEHLGRSLIQEWVPELAPTLDELEREDARHAKLLQELLERLQEHPPEF